MSADWRWRDMWQHGHWHWFGPHSRKPCSPWWLLLAGLSHRRRQRATFAPASLWFCYQQSSMSGRWSPLDFGNKWSSLNQKCKVFWFEWRLHSFIHSSTELAFQLCSFRQNSLGFICVYWAGLLWMIWALPGDWLTEKSGTAEKQSAAGGSYPNISPIS